MLDELEKYLKYAVFCVSTKYHNCSINVKKRKEREDAGTEVGFLSTFPTICQIKRLKESLKRDVLPRQHNCNAHQSAVRVGIFKYHLQMQVISGLLLLICKLMLVKCQLQFVSN